MTAPHDDFTGPNIVTTQDNESRLKFWHDEFVRLYNKTEQEAVERAQIKLSPKFQELESIRLKAEEEQKAMLSVVTDSSLLVETAKKEMMDNLQQSGLTRFKNIQAKMGKKNVVNTNRLLETLGGDMGIFLEMVGVTQKALKDFSSQNPTIQKELSMCIDSFPVMKDLEITFDFSSLRE